MDTSARTYIEPDSGSDVSALQQSRILMANQRDRLLSLVDEQIDVMSDRIQNMVISGSAGRPSNESALTASTVDRSEFAGIDIGEHDTIPIEKVNEAEKRSVKRRCCICSKNTRWQCSNAGCRSVSKEVFNKMQYGTNVCDPKVGARNNLKQYPNNTLSCMQLHRNEIRKRKHEEYKDRIANRRSDF